MKRYCLLGLFFTVLFCVPVFADSPFQGYSYNFWGHLVPSPAAYAPARSFGATDICPSLERFNNPTDLHVDQDNNIYIVDNGNNRIIIFDVDLNLIEVLEGFYLHGEFSRFNSPTGVFVSHERELYIADTLNHRVVILDSDFNFIRQITSPEIEGLQDDFEFLPLRIVVDHGGRTYVIVQRVFEGIMSFDPYGEFLQYFGTIHVGFNAIEFFWRLFMTDEQIGSQVSFIPTEFNNMAIDQYGFIYTTHITVWYASDQVMRFNPRGDNVIVNFNENVALNGDQRFRPAGTLSGPSMFVDIIARSHGRYSTLDSTRGRVFTYDSEGNVLYVFSGIGSMDGMTRRPIALEVIGEDIWVLDAHGHGRITHFVPTEYGALINTAIMKRYDGDEAGAVDAWRQLVTLDENFSLAWSGIGRSMMAAGYNAEAMQYLRRGMDLRHYSVAFRRNRMEVMQNILPNMLTGGAVLIVAYVAFSIFRKKRKKGAVSA